MIQLEVGWLLDLTWYDGSIDKEKRSKPNKMEHENLSGMASLISDLRNSKNLTQKELAEQLGITDKAVSKWERGLSCPDISLLPKLSQILGVTIGELVKGEEKDLSALNNNAINQGSPHQSSKLQTGSSTKKAIWKVTAEASAISLLCLFIIIGCNTAIEKGFSTIAPPLSITFFIWLVLILGAFIVGKNKISAVLFCGLLIYITTFFYALLNATPERVLTTFNGFPKNYIPHYTLILVMFVSSVILLVIAVGIKKAFSDKSFLPIILGLTIIILSVVTVSAIMDYVDLNALGVDWRFTVLLLLTFLMSCISLAFWLRHQIKLSIKSQ
jgi:transcriptional regulator with XRE-family HTH domain